jgi:hypothetical protein
LAAHDAVERSDDAREPNFGRRAVDVGFRFVSLGAGPGQFWRGHEAASSKLLRVL